MEEQKSSQNLKACDHSGFLESKGVICLWSLVCSFKSRPCLLCNYNIVMNIDLLIKVRLSKKFFSEVPEIP